jgi:hypothetical protein
MLAQQLTHLLLPNATRRQDNEMLQELVLAPQPVELNAISA